MVSLSQDCQLLQQEGSEQSLDIFNAALSGSFEKFAATSTGVPQRQSNEENMIMDIYSKAMYCKSCINTDLGILSPGRLKSNDIRGHGWNALFSTLQVDGSLLGKYIFLVLSKPYCLLKIHLE